MSAMVSGIESAMRDGDPVEEPRTCYYCRHAVEECCDFGQCGLLMDDVRPRGFETMDDVLEWLDDHRLDLQTDGCGSWEEYR